jgi:ArsR family transcriptional regulator, arsenate/arsenite/antimonite-responsive transcriptional repressor
MKLIRIYQCLCDPTRLRILSLLLRGPLCGCHLQEILGESQVNISRHLSYLKKRGLVEAQRHQHWMIYHLPAKRPAELESNLQCLQDCQSSDPIFKKDLIKFQKVVGTTEAGEVLAAACCSTSCTKAGTQRLPVS